MKSSRDLAYPKSKVCAPPRDSPKPAAAGSSDPDQKPEVVGHSRVFRCAFLLSRVGWSEWSGTRAFEHDGLMDRFELPQSVAQESSNRLAAPRASVPE